MGCPDSRPVKYNLLSEAAVKNPFAAV